MARGNDDPIQRDEAARASLLDRLAQGVGEAVTDIRQKVVEEGWFGRAVTPPPLPEGFAREPTGVPSFAERCGLGEASREEVYGRDMPVPSPTSGRSFAERCGLTPEPPAPTPEERTREIDR